MKKLYFLFCVILLIGGGCTTRSQSIVIEGHGGLHVLHLPDQSVRIVAMDSIGTITDTTFISVPKNLLLRYVAADSATHVRFDFPLHEPIDETEQPQEIPARMFVLSDLHGRLDAFTALLQSNGVVDEALNWSYGSDQLIFIGDVLDRGRDDNGIFWLLYKLEKEARQAGGQVRFLIGNHEDLVMKNDLRYVHKSNLDFAERAGIPYAELYGPWSELGQWVRSKPMVAELAGNLFVHAGLSKAIMENGYTFDEMNELSREYLGYPTKERAKMHPRNEMFFGNAGPLWYRGLVFDTEKHPAIPSEDLDEILRHYAVDRIIVGHSEVEEIEFRYDGRVIPVNVRHYKNYPENRTGALLIVNGVFYSVNYTGEKVRLEP